MKEKRVINLYFGFLLFFFISATFAFASTATYTYDSLNRLVRVQFDDGAVIRYTYDAVGNRVTKQVTASSGGSSASAPMAAPESAPAAVSATVAPPAAGPRRTIIATGYPQWPGVLQRIRQAGTPGELENLQSGFRDTLEQSGLSPEEKTRYLELAAQELEARADDLRRQPGAAGEPEGASRDKKAAARPPHNRILKDKEKIYTADSEQGSEKPRP